MMTETQNPLAREIKSTVAKLLATENITVTRGNYTTAWFDIKSRTLGLPVLKSETENTIDLFIGHEVGHALYTPTDMVDEWKSRLPDVPFSTCNVLEDVRIEREIRNRYPGLIRSFLKGYSDLWDAGFFGVEEADFPTMGLIDRINLKAKIPSLDVPFSDEEEEIVSKCLAVDTAEDVYRLGRELADFVDKNKEEEEPDKNNPDEDGESETSPDGEGDSDETPKNGPEGDSPDESGDESEDESGDESEDESEDESGDYGSNGFDDADAEDSDDRDSTHGDEDYPSNEDESGSTEETTKVGPDPAGDSKKDLESEIERNMNKKIEDDQVYLGDSFSLLEPSREKINSAVIFWNDIVAEREKEGSVFNTHLQANDYREEYITYRKSARKKVSSLRREFDRKKAAVENVRASTAKTGVIDVNRLHRYRYDEDIFATTTRKSISKSHGMLFLIDFSGSMSSTFEEIVKHTLDLVEFCRNSSIPFEVYTFSGSYDEMVRARCGQDETKNDGEIILDGLKICEVLSSNMKKNEYNKACYQLFVLGKMARTHNEITKYEYMNSTPLDEALVVSHYLLRDFIRRHKVQVPNFFLLSDGNGIDFAVERKNLRRMYRYGYGSICGGRRRKWDVKHDMVPQLVDNMKKTLNVNTICFFLVEDQQEAERQIRYYVNRDLSYKEAQKAARNFWKNDKIIFSEGCRGFNRYIVLSSEVDSVPDSTEDFGGNLSSDAKASAIAKAFKSHQSNSKVSKVFVSELIEAVAKNL